MKLINDDFLLSNDVSRNLYHKYAEKMPIADYHCHLSPREIAEDTLFENITQLWLKGDHYKWRLMRNAGIDEEYITGDADDREKFRKWIYVLERSIGNPIYHWCHLELKKYFHFEDVVSLERADEIYDMCNRIISEEHLSARKLIEMSDVTVLCTTDSPEDELIWHEKLREDETFNVKVLPAYRPDRILQIGAEDYADYIINLGKRYCIDIKTFNDLVDVLDRSVEYFNAKGCRTADHGIEKIPFRKADRSEASAIFSKALAGASVTEVESEYFQTEVLTQLAMLYSKYGWVMQLHYGAERNVNTSMFERLGPDTGYDCIANTGCGQKLAAFMNHLETSCCLPKTIIYSLNPIDNDAIDTICGCYSETGVKGKVQHGSAWWFNDSYNGMTEHMKCLASKGMIANFVGMLTDSRSFLSYTRHDYFRRILCEVLSQWVVNNQFPYNEKLLGEIVQDISYNNTIEYFKF